MRTLGQVGRGRRTRLRHPRPTKRTEVVNEGLRGRKKLPHGVPVWVGDGAVFFVSVNCRERAVNSLCREPTAEAIRASVEFRMARGDWWVHLLLLMPDHLHMLVSFPRDRDMRVTVGKWKEYVAKQTGVRWQRDFFDHRLRTEASREEKAVYIRANPMRAGLIKAGEVWPYQWVGSDGDGSKQMARAAPTPYLKPENRTAGRVGSWTGRAGPPDPPAE